MEKKQKTNSTLFFDRLTFRRTNTFIYPSSDPSMHHICLSLLAFPWPDLFWSFIISPLLLLFLSYSYFFFSPFCLCGELANRHHWQWEPIHCQEGLSYVCLCMCICVHVCMCVICAIVSVKSNARLEGENICIFAI